MNRPDNTDTTPEITVETLHERLVGDAADPASPTHVPAPQVVDVREGWEWTQGHIAGAAHIPLNELPARLGEIDPDRDVAFICHLGGRSEMATRFGRQQGLARATNVLGGMDAWEARGYPVSHEP